MEDIVMPAEGGTPREVTPEDHNQGDPTWMPKGDAIVFAGMPWLDYGKTSGPNIHIAHVNSAQVSDVPDSENLFSPRCSRDGRYIAALAADSSKTDALRHGEKILEAARRFTFRL